MAIERACGEWFGLIDQNILGGAIERYFSQLEARQREEFLSEDNFFITDNPPTDQTGVSGEIIAPGDNQETQMINPRTGQ